MSDRKFTDDEVIKALECCSDCECYNARAQEDCPLINVPFCKNYMRKQALALINRQKAENERLNGCVKTEEEVRTIAKAVIDAGVAIAKSEAVKEFAERLQERLYSIPTVYNSHFGRMIDNLVKEMTEGEVKCKDCEYLELELPYGVCSKAYKGIVNPDDSCGKGKRKGDQPRKEDEGK